jgi:hypothetical protein
MLCQYKDMFGAPREGAHAYRVFNIAVVDVAATIALGVALQHYLPYRLPSILLGLFVLGVIMHHLFCVDTTINTLLGL